MTKPKPNKGVSALLEDREVLLDLNEVETVIINTVFATLKKTYSWNKTKDITKRINKYMKRIGAALGIEIDLKTYSARHSFATILKRSGASTEFIGESLGHKNNKTTENYLDSFEDEMKANFQNKLLEF